jgi:hypothetical protein
VKYNSPVWNWMGRSKNCLSEIQTKSRQDCDQRNVRSTLDSLAPLPTGESVEKKRIELEKKSRSGTSQWNLIYFPILGPTYVVVQRNGVGMRIVYVSAPTNWPLRIENRKSFFPGTSTYCTHTSRTVVN